MREIVFEITQEQDGGYTAEATGESIFTEADTWQELRANAQEGGRSLLLRPAEARSHPPSSVMIHLGGSPCEIPPSFTPKCPSNSSGSGNTTVVFFSTPISTSVCR